MRRWAGFGELGFGGLERQRLRGTTSSVTGVRNAGSFRGRRRQPSASGPASGGAGTPVGRWAGATTTAPARLGDAHERRVLSARVLRAGHERDAHRSGQHTRARRDVANGLAATMRTATKGRRCDRQWEDGASGVGREFEMGGVGEPSVQARRLVAQDRAR